MARQDESPKWTTLSPARGESRGLVDREPVLLAIGVARHQVALAPIPLMRGVANPLKALITDLDLLYG